MTNEIKKALDAFENECGLCGGPDGVGPDPKFRAALEGAIDAELAGYSSCNRARRAAEDRVEALEGALRRVLPYAKSAAEPMPTYGAFPGGDPREFTPDPDDATEAEREAHKRACTIWDAGAQAFEANTPAHRWEVRGEQIAHVASVKYGLGTYTIRDDEAAAAVQDARAALASGKENT